MGAMSAPCLVVGFDLDLTLVDSRERIMTSYLRALHDVGAPVTREDLYRLSRNSFDGAWLTEPEKVKHRNDLDRVFG